MRRILLLTFPLILSGCGLAPATIAGLAGMGGMGLGSLLSGPALPVTYPTLAQEAMDLEAAATVVHSHEMRMAAIEQSPVVTVMQTPVQVVPSVPPLAPQGPAVTPVPPPPVLPPKPVPLPRQQIGGAWPVWSSAVLALAQ